MQEQQHDTFLSCDEMLRYEARRCKDAVHGLETLGADAAEPGASALREAAALERELIELLTDYAARGPQKVLATRLQYTADSSARQHEPESVDAALRGLIALNAEVGDKLRVAAGNDIPADVAQELDTLWRDVDAQSRRIAMLHVTLRDI
ncbi:MAG: hypothetical protein KDI01_09295 [Halioglobus sp.]|nr:hypothetical protein [Halioglobus sp.]